jgi:integrase
MSAAVARRAGGRIDLAALREKVTVGDVLRHLGGDVSSETGRCACVLHGGGNVSALSFDRTRWNCFSTCARGGDIFELVRLAYGCDFPRAVAIVAELAGVDIEGAPRLERRDVERRQTIQRRREALRRWRDGRLSEWLLIIGNLDADARRLGLYLGDPERCTDADRWRLLASLHAMPWAHVDLDTRRVRVTRSLSRVRIAPGSKKWRPHIGPPKSDAGRRELELPPQTVALLREWKLRTPYKADDNFVFTSPTGKPRHRATLSVRLRELLETLPDLPKITPHGLRHTFASILIMDNRPVTQVAKLMGHGKPTVTLEKYAHWFTRLEEANRDAVEVLAGRVFGSGLVADQSAQATTA